MQIWLVFSYEYKVDYVDKNKEAKLQINNAISDFDYLVFYMQNH